LTEDWELGWKLSKKYGLENCSKANALKRGRGVGRRWGNSCKSLNEGSIWVIENKTVDQREGGWLPVFNYRLQSEGKKSVEKKGAEGWGSINTSSVVQNTKKRESFEGWTRGVLKGFNS